MEHSGDGEELPVVRATFTENIELPKKLRKTLEKKFPAPTPIQAPLACILSRVARCA